MLEVLRTRGYHGAGLSDVLVAAGAPKGVLYHHFPGGKSELAVSAIDVVVGQICVELDNMFQRTRDPVQALGVWLGGAQRSLEKSGFERGCPLATIALESSADDGEIRNALAQGFAAIRSRLVSVLVGSGLSEAKSRSLAALIVSAYEGALLQARVAGSVRPMRDTAEALIGLVQLNLDVRPSART
ncbi:MAG: TetR/AcrR family transcriptional regulator [Rhodocyclaceae bacterium]|nr:TetR/AcrR family transcriptional regulator [Rhodocyclaceae bacterium]